MRRVLSIGCAALVVAGMIATSAGAQTANRSDNIRQIHEVPILITPDDPGTEEDERILARGSDLAFQGNLAVAGAWEGFGTFRLSPDGYMQQLGFAPCNGAQGDVSIYEDLAFVSVDTPQVKTDDTPGDGSCDSKDASRQQVALGEAWEGVRVFSIKDPRRPRLIGVISGDCGSHTHTLLPSGKTLYLYMHSYPLTGGLGPACNYAVHRKNLIFEIDEKNPSKSKQVGSLDVTPSPGCHDATFFPERKLAVAACLTESQVWSIKDPENPTIISRIHNPFMIHHSSALTWDGKMAVIGDEFAGAAAGAGCAPGDSRSPLGAMWFYDISDPEAPVNVGHFGPPRTAFPDSGEEAARHACTNHQMSVLPMKDPERYVVSTSWYSAGISLVDFSDPANPKEVAYSVPDNEGQAPDTWAAYWYNGFIYTNDLNLARAAPVAQSPSVGLASYAVKGYDERTVHYFKTRSNPQVQIHDFR